MTTSFQKLLQFVRNAHPSTKLVGYYQPKGRFWGKIVVEYRYSVKLRNALLTNLPSTVRVESNHCCFIEKGHSNKGFTRVTYHWHPSHDEKSVKGLITLFKGLNRV